MVGATVNLISGPSGQRVRTDGSGQFRALVPSGEVKLSLQHSDDYVPVNGWQITLGEISAANRELDVGVIEVVKGVSLQGLVRDDQGRPASGAEIAAWRSDGRSVFLGPPGTRPVSNAQGEFTIEGLPPGNLVEVTARLNEAATASATAATPGVTKDLMLTISPANTVSLGGRVVDEYGKPIAGAQVGVRSRWKTSIGAEVTQTQYAIPGPTGIVTDAEGRFQLRRTLLHRAQHQVYAYASGRRQNESERFASTTPSFFDLTLYPTPPPEQAEIRADFDAGSEAENKGEYAEAEAKYESALKRAAELKIIDPLLLSYWREGLAHTLLDRGQYDDAKREARIVPDLAAEKALPRADHFEVEAKACAVLAYIQMMQLSRIGGGGITLYLRSQSLFDSRGSGRDHPAVGRLLSRSGGDLSDKGLSVRCGTEAEPILERSDCRILETAALGPDHAGINRYPEQSRLRRLTQLETVGRGGACPPTGRDPRREDGWTRQAKDRPGILGRLTRAPSEGPRCRGRGAGSAASEVAGSVMAMTTSRRNGSLLSGRWLRITWRSDPW